MVSKKDWQKIWTKIQIFLPTLLWIPHKIQTIIHEYQVTKIGVYHEILHWWFFRQNCILFYLPVYLNVHFIDTRNTFNPIFYLLTSLFLNRIFQVYNAPILCRRYYNFCFYFFNICMVIHIIPTIGCIIGGFEIKLQIQKWTITYGVFQNVKNDPFFGFKVLKMLQFFIDLHSLRALYTDFSQ